MSSELIVDELTGRASAGSIAVTAEGGTVTTSLQQGLAKCWVNFTGITTTAARDSFNVASFTDVGTGKTNVVYTSAMANNDYSGAYYQNGSASTAVYGLDNAYGGAFGIDEFRTTALIKVAAHGSGLIDASQNDVLVFGDLA